MKKIVAILFLGTLLKLSGQVVTNIPSPTNYLLNASQVTNVATAYLNSSNFDKGSLFVSPFSLTNIDAGIPDLYWKTNRFFTQSLLSNTAPNALLVNVSLAVLTTNAGFVRTNHLLITNGIIVGIQSN